MSLSGTLIPRNYTGFRGVDFTDKEVNFSRSPDALNMWKNYKTLGKCIETRPDINTFDTYTGIIFGLFFFKAGLVEHRIVHHGTTLTSDSNGVKTVIFNGMAPRKSVFFVYANILYIKDGINYLQFDGETCSEVEGFIPTTTIGKKPSGGGETYQDVNLLTGKRYNYFQGDGESKEYVLDTQSLDTSFVVEVKINDEVQLISTYTVDKTLGKVIFKTAPPKPLTDGQDNVSILFSKTIAGARDRINKCTLATVFDNRVFFSGNQDYPNAVFHSSLDNPAYCSDLDYYNEGLDLSPVKAMVAGNNALWVFKEPSQANTTVFYHTPAIEGSYGKVYPSTHSSITIGCSSTGINFNDDIVFFSDRGMEGISGDVTTEQVVAHRSTMVDSKMLSESLYKSGMILEKWDGYLLVIIGSKIYLADSRATFTNENHFEYEWYYWTFNERIIATQVKDGVLYLCTENGKIYTLNRIAENLNSHWTTPTDEFDAPQYAKTTNKKGGVADLDGSSITISVSTNGNNTFQEINTYVPNGYVVFKVKKKKFKSLQLRFSSSKPFKLYSSTIEAFIGNYLKS